MRRLSSACLVALAVMLAAGALACRKSPAPPAQKFSQKLVVLGFDGLDPDLVRQWVAAGQLPNFKKLIDQGGLYDLETTHSAESPTAWASFATGVNPGKHNIYDFLVRDTQTYLPDLGMVHREPAKFLLNWIPIVRPRVTSIRGGTSFWVTAGAAGVRTSILTVPVTWPPEEVPAGELLSGLPLPDIRGTMGTFSYFGTDLSRYEEGNTEFGGILKRIVFDGNVAHPELDGPPNPIVRQQMLDLRKRPQFGAAEKAELEELGKRADVRVPFTVEWSRGSQSANIEIQGQRFTLKEREWSKWVDLSFRVNVFITLKGMAQFFLVKAGDDLQLYVSPVNWLPEAPPLPMSSPDTFSQTLAKAMGRYRTLGWAEATWPLEEGRIDEQAFMEDTYRAFDDRANVILNRLAAGNWDLLVGVIESTDRVEHMMWRLIDPKHPMYDAALAEKYGDSIASIYRRSDQFVGEVMERVGPNVPILIVSDHGFQSFRKAVNVNTWLVQEGFMTLKGQESGEKRLDDLFVAGTFWEHVDWSRTKAYAMGLGQIYFNTRGREGQGIVSPGSEAKALADSISGRLLALTDPDTGEPVVKAVYKRDEVYKGQYLENASDLQLGFHDGYRVSWQTSLGGAPAGVLYPNMKRWSGDHGSFDYANTAGTLISSKPLPATRYSVMDVAPSVLRYFGVAVPDDIDGKPFF